MEKMFWFWNRIPKDLDIYLNEDTAKKLNLNITKEFLK